MTPDLVNYSIIALSIGVRVAVVFLILNALVKFNEGLELLERGGMGVVGGAFLMTIPVVLDVDKNGTPFDSWAGTLLAIGILMFIVGRLRKLRRHDRANKAQIKIALENRAARERGTA